MQGTLKRGAGDDVLNMSISAKWLCLWVQVAFNIMLPCMLFTKVGATLAATSDWSLLGIPLAATMQVRTRDTAHL